MGETILKDKNLENALFIIDGSSFLYRAYYSIPPLSTKDGIAVNAVYGFCRMIKKLIDTHSPKYLVVVWDGRGLTFRHEIYSQYKQLRQATPNDLSHQRYLIKEFAKIIDLAQLEQESIEADDLMYSIAKKFESAGNKAILVSSDKDFQQVLSDNVFIFDPFKDALVKKEDVELKFGFPIEKIPFYYALIGDVSDNIPGVPGVGPKTAQKLVIQFNSLEELYHNIEKVESERIRNLLLTAKDNAFLSQKLFLLKMYDISLTKKDCEFYLDNWKKAKEFFESLDFKSLLKTIDPTSSGSDSSNSSVSNLKDKYKFKCVTELPDLVELCNKIREHKAFAVDTECESLELSKDGLVGISICFNEGESYYIPFGHKTDEKQLSKDIVLDTLRPIFEDETIEKYLHNAKFDNLVLSNAGIELKGIVFDTIIAASLIAKEGQRISLKSLSEYYFGERMIYFSELVNKHSYKNISFVPIGLATEYAAADAHQTLKLYNLFKKDLEEQKLADLFYKLEMPLMQVLIDMERNGILIDKEVLKNIDNTVSQEIKQIYAKILETIGEKYSEINLNSPKQLAQLLFEDLKLPVVKKTTQKTGYSTDHEVLKELSKQHVVPSLIIQYRECYKLKSTYLEPLIDHINIKTKRIHTSFNQTNVATGRLASSDPNLQNIPVDRFKVRSIFRAKPGHILLSADYSQIELRVLGYLSQDETLLTAFKENKDIHALTASGIFNVPIDQINNEHRTFAKRINFGILYGLTAHGLSKDLEISHSVAKSYIEKFMAQYPGVQKWMEIVIEKVKEKGYVETFFNRRRYLPGIYEKNKTLFDLAKRVAINTVSQGTAAELVKLGMINLDKALKQEKLNAKILLQIHDELLLEVPENEIVKTENLIKSVLENVVNWNIPLTVSTRSGLTWQDVTK